MIHKYSKISEENSKKDIWLRLWICKLHKKHKKEIKKETGLDVFPSDYFIGFSHDDFANNNITIRISYERFNK